ncbi:MAG: hypothetical protein PHU71_05685 [Candidatus Gracilibacteria bacterium]|nr:hypothetical protein [Candidatus Gracilibacteria bacterium]
MNKKLLQDWSNRQEQSREDRKPSQEPSMLPKVVGFVLPGTNKPEPAGIKPVEDTYQGGALIGKMIEALQVLGLPATVTMALAMLVAVRATRVQATDVVMPGTYYEAPSEEELIKLFRDIESIAIELSEEIEKKHEVKSLTKVGVAPVIPKTTAKGGYTSVEDYINKNLDKITNVINQTCTTVGWPIEVAEEILNILQDSKLRDQFIVRNQSFLRGQCGLTMPSLKNGENLDFTGPFEWKGKDAMTGDYMVIPHNGKYYLLFIPSSNDDYNTGSMPACYNITPIGVFDIPVVIAPTPTPCPDCPEQATSPSLQIPTLQPKNWEVNLGTDSGFQLEEAERAFRVDLSVDSTSNPDGNGNYTVKLDANITVISGYDNASGFRTVWDTPAGQKPAEDVFLELQAGTYTFTAIVTDKYGNTSEHPITSRVPGDNAMSSDDKGSIEGIGAATNFRASLAYHFKNGQVKVFGSNTEAGLGAGLHRAGEHLFGGADIEGGYNFNAKSPFAAIEGRFGLTWKKFSTYLRAKYKTLVGGDHQASVVEGNLGAEFKPNDTFSIYAEGGVSKYDLGTDEEQEIQGSGQAGIRIRF